MTSWSCDSYYQGIKERVQAVGLCVVLAVLQRRGVLQFVGQLHPGGILPAACYLTVLVAVLGQVW